MAEVNDAPAEAHAFVSVVDGEIQRSERVCNVWSPGSRCSARPHMTQEDWCGPCLLDHACKLLEALLTEWS